MISKVFIFCGLWLQTILFIFLKMLSFDYIPKSELMSISKLMNLIIVWTRAKNKSIKEQSWELT
jgi:hypothetical protein